jgi:formyltetrahydrofolate hydrolase
MGKIIEQDVMWVSHRDQREDLVRRAATWHLQDRILNYGAKTVVFD